MQAQIYGYHPLRRNRAQAIDLYIPNNETHNRQQILCNVYIQAHFINLSCQLAKIRTINFIKTMQIVIIDHVVYDLFLQILHTATNIIIMVQIFLPRCREFLKNTNDRQYKEKKFTPNSRKQHLICVQLLLKRKTCFVHINLAR